MTMTYEQAYNKLDTILESAITNYEVEVLTEGAKEAIKKAGEVALAAIKKLIQFVKDLIKKIKDRLIGRKGEVRYKSTISEDAIKPEVVKEKVSDIILGGFDRDDSFFFHTEQIGTAGYISIDKVKSNISEIERMISLVQKKVEEVTNTRYPIDILLDREGHIIPGKGKNIRDDLYKHYTILNRGLRYYNGVLLELYNLLGDKDDKKPTNESVGLTTKQKMAKLLIEAAAIIGDEFDEKDPSIIQDPIDEIPEEKPAAGVEQDPDVSGGAGEKLDLEEIKDLVGDDKEAIALLLDESVTIDFGI